MIAFGQIGNNQALTMPTLQRDLEAPCLTDSVESDRESSTNFNQFLNAQGSLGDQSTRRLNAKSTNWPFYAWSVASAKRVAFPALP